MVIAAAGACAQGELLDGALVVWLYNLAKDDSKTLYETHFISFISLNKIKYNNLFYRKIYFLHCRMRNA